MIRTLGAESVEDVDVRAGDARVENVAADRDGQSRHAAFCAADRQRVQKGLGRMLMRAVSGIDDGTVDLLGQ